MGERKGMATASLRAGPRLGPWKGPRWKVGFEEKQVWGLEMGVGSQDDPKLGVLRHS